MTETAINTGPYRITPAAYLKVTAAGVISRLLTSVALTSVICTIVAFFDIRWLLVGMIVVFLIIPFVVFHIYLTRLLMPDAQRWLAPKQVVIHPFHSLIITYLPIDETHTPPDAETVDWQNISTIRRDKRHLILDIDGHTQPLLIPTDALPLQCGSLDWISTADNDTTL